MSESLELNDKITFPKLLEIQCTIQTKFAQGVKSIAFIAGMRSGKTALGLSLAEKYNKVAIFGPTLDSVNHICSNKKLIPFLTGK